MAALDTLNRLMRISKLPCTLIRHAIKIVTLGRKQFTLQYWRHSWLDEDSVEPMTGDWVHSPWTKQPISSDCPCTWEHKYRNAKRILILCCTLNMMLIGVGEQTKASGLLKFSTLMSCLNSSQLMIKMDADTLNARANLFASLNPLVENICVRDGNMRLCKFRRAFCGRPVRSSSYYLSYVFIRKEDLALQDSLLLSTVSKTIPTSVLNFLKKQIRTVQLQ